MSAIPYVSADDLAALVPMPDAIDVLEAAFADGDGRGGPARSTTRCPTAICC